MGYKSKRTNERTSRSKFNMTRQMIYKQIGINIKNWIDDQVSKKNYWQDISNIICCKRSDIYLRSLIEKIRHFRETEREKREEAKKRNQLSLSKQSKKKLASQSMVNSYDATEISSGQSQMSARSRRLSASSHQSY